MTEPLASLLAALVGRVTVNRVQRRGARWVKTRMRRAPLLIAPGNVYLGRSGSSFRMHVSAEEWAAYEVAQHRALHGEDSAGRLDSRTIWTAHLEGESLTSLVSRAGNDARKAMRAAGREIGRAHAVVVSGRAFSHGDLHLSNLLFDEATGRAREIDFETPHDPAHSALVRHADDLQALVLDILGKVRDAARAEALVSALAQGYRSARPDAEEVLRAAAARLRVERSVLRRSLQLVRTRGLGARSLAELTTRLRARLMPLPSPDLPDSLER
jgi:tRNA A-37 threonylcarbamoyl transferase component Bud32